MKAELVALGGLLHDIGKFVQRASRDRKKHQEFGYEFLKKYVDRYLKNYRDLPLFALYHHKSDLKGYKGDVRLRNILNIVCEADNLSAGERKTEKNMSFDIENPLECIFSSVDLGKGNAEKMYYPLRAFFPETYFHPVKSHKNTYNDYKSLFENFEKEFENAVASLNFNTLMHVLEKYTTFIPAMITKTNDISLYDHLKMTSAIALCLYHYHQSSLDRDIEKEIESRREKKFLIVGGDISGIQEFIYTITSRGALKYLRARSLFLELLVEDVVMEIIDRLQLTRANIIFAGGGRFYLLTHNTVEARKEIEEIGREINRWLFDRFWGKLYFAIDILEINGEELSKFRRGKNSIWKLINAKLKERKLRKFLDVAGTGKLIENYIPDSDVFGECDVCKTPAILEEVDTDKVCQTCNDFLQIGKVIPKSLGFARVSKSHSAERKYELPFSFFVPIHSYKELERCPEGSEIYTLEYNFTMAQKFNVIPLSVSRYYAENENGNVKEFDELAKEAKGAKKLAVLRMDVDDLGKVFSMGLKDNETISRMATLSRFMNHFFKNCIDLICSGEVHAEAPRISDTKKKEVVVVYAGGDDLFIVGAWDHVFELAFEIENAFRKYVGSNPNITISAGYGIFDPKFPLYRMAEVTGEREERAKEEGELIERKNGVEIRRKGRIYLIERDAVGKFKESYKWDEFSEIWERYITRIYHEQKLLIPRTAIRRILDARREYVRNPKGFKWSILLIYYLSRTKVDGRRLIEVIPAIATRDSEKIRAEMPQDIYCVDVPLKLVDFAVRGG